MGEEERWHRRGPLGTSSSGAAWMLLPSASATRPDVNTGTPAPLRRYCSGTTNVAEAASGEACGSVGAGSGAARLVRPGYLASHSRRGLVLQQKGHTC